ENPRSLTRSTMDDENGNSRPAHHALRRGSEPVPERLTVAMAAYDNEIPVVLSSHTEYLFVRSADTNLLPDQPAADLRAQLTESHARPVLQVSTSSSRQEARPRRN